MNMAGGPLSKYVGTDFQTLTAIANYVGALVGFVFGYWVGLRFSVAQAPEMFVSFLVFVLAHELSINLLQRIK